MKRGEMRSEEAARRSNPRNAVLKCPISSELPNAFDARAIRLAKAKASMDRWRGKVAAGESARTYTINNTAPHAHHRDTWGFGDPADYIPYETVEKIVANHICTFGTELARALRNRP